MLLWDEISGLDEAQMEFLKNAPRRYDFVLVKRRRIAPGLLGEPEETYLVEVKTTFRGRRHDLEGGIEGMKRKLPEAEDIETAKALGFRRASNSVVFISVFIRFSLQGGRLFRVKVNDEAASFIEQGKLLKLGRSCICRGNL